MKRDEPENLDLLAAEYVLGTLTGGARRSFERRQAREPFVVRRVRGWEERLAPLALRLAPVARRRRSGTRSQRRTAARRAPADGVRSRPRSPPSRCSVSAGCCGRTCARASRRRPRRWRSRKARRCGAWTWPRTANHLEVEAVGAVDYPRIAPRELWALPAGAAPVSLGLMPQSGSIRLALDDRQRAALAQAEHVAVSDEPQGGSPTGAPTGDVLGVAPITRT